MRKLSYLFVLLLAASVIFTSCRDDDNEPIDPNPPGIGDTTDPGVVINGIRWATRNVATRGTFAAYPHSAGMLFQWNRPQGWAAIGNVTGWNSAAAEGTIWERANDPCPEGWRVPTRYELQSLLASGVARHWTMQNGIGGFVFGTAPQQLFLPASGFRHASGALSGTHEQGFYWSSTYLAATTNVNNFHFTSGTDARITSAGRAQGFSVRCVEDISIPVSSISLDKEAMTLPVTGVAYPLVATLAPANATDTRVTWSSGNNAIATISVTGVVTAHAIGNTTISATTACGSHKATVAVTVTAIPTISSSLNGVVINDVRWATRNVELPGMFAISPQRAGMFYQWGRHIGWTHINPMLNSNGEGEWDTSLSEGMEWARINDPCPQGWRVPTPQELQSLNSAGSVWITYRGVHGRLFGTAPAVIFLPAAGWRSNANGALINVGTQGSYWSNTPIDNVFVRDLWFGSSFSFTDEGWERTNALSVRCVAE